MIGQAAYIPGPIYMPPLRAVHRLRGYGVAYETTQAQPTSDTSPTQSDAMHRTPARGPMRGMGLG